jgi:hypothetical protein
VEEPLRTTGSENKKGRARTEASNAEETGEEAGEKAVAENRAKSGRAGSVDRRELQSVSQSLCSVVVTSGRLVGLAIARCKVLGSAPGRPSC